MRICDKCIHDKVCLLSKSRANCELFDEKRPHGEWEFIGENLFMCTKCGYIADANYLEKWKVHTFGSEFPDFCPNCGAKMKEGDRNEVD